MTEVQFIRTLTGMNSRCSPRGVRARRALDERCEVAIPKAVADRIAAGENPILVVRDWGGITKVALADAAGISQSYVADFESGRRRGSPRQLAAVAAALKVPLDLLIS